MTRKLLEYSAEQLAIAANYEVEELARLHGISTRHLRREFKREFQSSPQKWLDCQRIKAAQQLLQIGLPVNRVARELGFKQVSHFCRQFKAHTNLTPTEYVALQRSQEPKCPSQITNVRVG